MRKLLSYFLQGLLFIAPVVITVYIIYQIVVYLDAIVPVDIPGLGLVIVVVGLTLIGFLSSTLIFKPIFNLLERLIKKTPLVKIIYTALRDLFSAFMAGEERFRHPVLVKLNEPSELYRLGFVTQDNLSMLDIDDKVAVYFPHSYQISGNLMIVQKKNVKVLKGVSSTEMMKFIISGGVTELNALKEEDQDEKKKKKTSD